MKAEGALNIVLYVPSYLPGTLGGRELVVHYLAKSYMEAGHNVRVVGPAGWWRHRKAKFVYPVHRWFSIKGIPKEKMSYFHLRADLARRGCDILHVHSTYPPGFVAANLKQARKIPVVLTPHGADIHRVPEVGYGLRLDPVIDRKIRRAVRSADMLTAISASVEASLLSAGAEPEKIINIPNGVDIERFSASRVDKKAVCGRLDLPPDAKLIITIGRYEPRKGQDVLIRAMPGILKEEPAARLVIIGQKTEALRPVIEELGLHEQVRLAGTLKPPNIMLADGVTNEPDWLVEYCRHGSVYVSASIDEGAEGLSLALLEGMAAGLPVVATNISGNRDVVKDGGNGHVVEPGRPESLANAILSVITGNEERARMGRFSEKIIADYGWPAVAARYLEQYRSLLERSEWKG